MVARQSSKNATVSCARLDQAARLGLESEMQVASGLSRERRDVRDRRR